jgi:GT2 family glycosyltransferase
MALPSATVVVATYNRAPGLARLLKALERQDVGPDAFEVVVVDDGSKDSTQPLLREIETPYRLRSLRQRNQGPATARTAAAQIAVGETIVSLDDDVEPAPDLLRRHLEAHAAEPDIAAIGVMLPPADAKLLPWVRWEATGLAEQYASMQAGRWPPTPRQFYTANCSVPRRAVLAAGMFDPLFRRAEDVELAYRLRDLGIGFRFLPEAMINHRPHRTFESWQRMGWLYGFYDVLMWRDRGRHHIVPLAGHELKTQRPRVLRFLAEHAVGRPVLRPIATGVGTAARVASAVGLRGAGEAGYGALFNLRYWQGMCAALGGRDAFLSGLRLVEDRELATAERLAKEERRP